VSDSQGSSSSKRTLPLLSLSEVKNPQSLITFRFANRNVNQLDEIYRFRNLTELDVDGNQLTQEVPALMKLPFLKKLNLANN
jgi:Leucine-rich repeat (LRR) protein